MGIAPSPSPLTYAKSGVDRTEVSIALRRLLDEVHFRPPPTHGRPLGLSGHYAGIVQIGRERIAITTDTLGTKTLLTAAVGAWEWAGEDLVAVNANDLAAVGARASAFVDCLSVPRPEPETFAALGRGIDVGLRSSGMSLLGGETAVVPELVGGLDLGGTAIGFFPRGREPVTGQRIRPGDLLIGIPSRGVHANGFTLIRRLLREGSVDLAQPRPGAREPVGRELLRPTRFYASVSEALAGLSTTHGFAHISGGGVRNLVRLNPRVGFVLDRWPPPNGVFRWIQELGAIDLREMFQTFNMGIGFVAVTARERLSETLRRLARAGAPDAVVVGHVERGRGVRLPHLPLEYEGY
ncbi:MAG TPA: phosphoribosylformylglycinamidine cyclo-ligase [Thermoplasmata archaeon]|nr:phosphoribosylformylglycinamidine cyclo-ligase [Thermoplasmata archaeon]